LRRTTVAFVCFCSFQRPSRGHLLHHRLPSPLPLCGQRSNGACV
jgi:hypothetical protein